MIVTASLSPRKYIEVHGRPTAAEFHAAGMVAGKTSYELSWEVQSFVPIQEYRLLYRRIDMVSTVQCSTLQYTTVQYSAVQAPLRRIDMVTVSPNPNLSSQPCLF